MSKLRGKYSLVVPAWNMDHSVTTPTSKIPVLGDVHEAAPPSSHRAVPGRVQAERRAGPRGVEEHGTGGAREVTQHRTELLRSARC